MMKHSKILGVFGLLLAISIGLPLTVWAAGELLPRHVIPGGGGARLTGGDLVLHGALGQPVAGPASNASYRLCSGFWCGGVPEIVVPDKYIVYLPLVVRNYPPETSNVCPGKPIELNRPYYEHIDPADDYDWFSFEATAGANYIIETSELGANVDTRIGLHDVNCGGELATNDDFNYPASLASRIEWQAPASGIYHVWVKHSTAEIAHGSDNKYTLTISVNP
ncbi:MAG TPA: PPC domain-containing protein [Anaerolineae bacterium]|nr:PPC domain-containing protein [Anaerolineae bacterium]